MSLSGSLVWAPVLEIWQALTREHAPAMHACCQQVRPLDNLSKCRALLPPEDPESRAAHMAVKPRMKRDEVSNQLYTQSGQAMLPAA